MKILSDSVIAETRTFLLNRMNEAATARYFTEGNGYEVPLYKSVKADGRIELSIRVPAGVSFVEKIEIVDGDGVLLMTRTDPFEKSSARSSFNLFEVDVRGLLI